MLVSSKIGIGFTEKATWSEEEKELTEKQQDTT